MFETVLVCVVAVADLLIIAPLFILAAVVCAGFVFRRG